MTLQVMPFHLAYKRIVTYAQGLSSWHPVEDLRSSSHFVAASAQLPNFAGRVFRGLYFLLFCSGGIGLRSKGAGRLAGSSSESL
jgi:hypothetical protein